MHLYSKSFLKQDFNGFKGDRKFVENEYAYKLYSKLRSSIGGVYAWRITHANSDSERKRMTIEADLAFRQAFALCPYSPEAVSRYVDFLLLSDRIDDALLIALTAQSLDPQNDQIPDLVKRIRNHKKPD